MGEQEDEQVDDEDEQVREEDEQVDDEGSVDATTKAAEEVEEDIVPGIDTEKVETTTAAALDDDLDEETGTTVKAPAENEDFGADVDDEVVDGSSTVSPADEITEPSEEESVPQFGDKETTASPEEASGDSEGSGVDNTDGEVTTEKEIRPIESSTPADDDTSDMDEDVAIEGSGEEELGTTSFPDIMKILPEVIDEAINDLFDGATTDSTTDTDDEGITADPVVITVDAETTTEADDVIFSTVGPIQPLEDPSLSDEDEDPEATTVSIQEFTPETPADPESRDQEAAATEAPLADDATTPKEVSPEKMPRLDASNEITTEAGQPEMTTVASVGETGAEYKATTTQSSSETGTEPAPMEEDEAVTELDGGLVTVTPGTTSDETSVSSEEVDVDAPQEVTTVSPTSVTVLSIEETDEGVAIVTTMLPAEDEITTAKPADNIEDATGSQDEVGTTLKTASDTTTQATNIDGDNAEDQTTQKSEITTAMTDSNQIPLQLLLDLKQTQKLQHQRQ